MNRPIYESKEDLVNENNMKSILEAKWNCELNKCPIKYNVEWFAQRGKDYVAFVEFKHRQTLSIDKYPRYMMSLDKWLRAQQLSKEVKVPFIMVITFAEGTYHGVFHHDDVHDTRYMFGGRYDRGDAQDVEPMVLLPLKIFKKIEGI
jgi:hypothetical protein